MAPSDVLTAFPRTLRASTENPKVVYHRRSDLIAIHGRVAVPRELETVVAFEDPPVLVCRVGPGAVPRRVGSGAVGAVYALTPRGAPAVPTGLVLVRFTDGVDAAGRGRLLSREGFVLVESLPYAPSAAWVKALRGGIPASLSGIPALESLPDVVNVEPQMLRRPARR